MPATVALDLTPIRSGNTGVAQYARELYRVLSTDHPDIELRPFTVGRGDEPGVPIHRHLSTPLRVVHRAWRTLHLPRAEHIVGPIDVVHATDMVPAPSKAPTMVTIHDVLPLTMPERYGARYVRIARSAVDEVRRRGATVIADCQASADAIASVAGIECDRVVVAPIGHRPVPDPLPPPHVEPPYLLYVGAVTPRKGLTWLIEAYNRLPPTAPPLLVAGPDGMAAEEVHAAVADHDRARVRFLGRVSDTVLTSLYSHATLLCHPSEAEGFGMPVLEAMAFGVPVLAGDIPPVREVGGDAVVLVPPRDVGAWTDALGALLADETEQARRRDLGRVRAKDFTWSGCADIVAGVYRRLAGAANPGS